MLIYGRVPKSKKKKQTKKSIAEYEQWLNSHKPTTFSKGLKPQKVSVVSFPKLSIPEGRSTKHIPSLDTGLGNATKPIEGKRYTGTKMIGIGTLHKSNAVPVFNTEEAVEMAKMRRG